MGYAEIIAQKLTLLPPEKLVEVYDFVEFVAARAQADWSETAFCDLALAQALREPDPDPVEYALADCREIWR
jgi:hypothetical protein